MKELDSKLSKKESEQVDSPLASTKREGPKIKDDFDASKILGLSPDSGLDHQLKVPKLDTGELDELLKGLKLPETPKMDELESALKDSLKGSVEIPSLDELEKDAKLKPRELLR